MVNELDDFDVEREEIESRVDAKETDWIKKACIEAYHQREAVDAEDETTLYEQTRDYEESLNDMDEDDLVEEIIDHVFMTSIVEAEQYFVDPQGKFRL
jgi:S-adenosylmethionine synthetase